MLIKSERHTKGDLELWKELEEMDLAWYEANIKRMKYQEEKAIEEIKNFARKGKFYVGISWGKDSVIVAHLAYRARLFRNKEINAIHRRIKFHSMPLVWIKVNPIYNPECIDVEQAYLKKFFPEYERIEVSCKKDEFGYHATGTLEEGAKIASLKYSKRYISGINSHESGERRLSRIVHGISTENCCRPIIDWPEKSIFSYLNYYNLPIHPAYAMLGGGRYERIKIRVASLGGKRGDNYGRAEWEKEYYQDVLNKLI